MEFPFTQSEWKEILSSLYKRAAQDHPFHVLCKRDARAAIKLICGKEIPKEIKVRFESQPLEELILLLPLESAGKFDPQLTDKDLEEIASGMATVCVPIIRTFHLPHHTPPPSI